MVVVKECVARDTQGVFDFMDTEVVSTGFLSCTASSMFDVVAGIALNDNFVQLVMWYDNDWGHSNRIDD